MRDPGTMPRVTSGKMNFADDERSRIYLMLLVIASVYLVFFEVPLAFNARDIIDDNCYLGWLHRLLLLPETVCPHPYHLPGVALLWIPAGALARLTAFILREDCQHWITIFVGLTSFACWAGSLVIADRIVSLLTKPNPEPFRWTVAFLLSVPVLHYATARSTMAHAGEILLALTALFLAIRGRYTASLLVGLWLCATRINDAPILLVIIAKFWQDRKNSMVGITKSQERWLWIAASALVISGAAVVDLAFIHPYGGTADSPLVRIFKATSWHETLRVLAGDYWGLVFTGPFWLLCFGLSVIHFRKLSWMARACWLWMAILLWVAIGWEGMGNSFGYRYLIGTYAGALIIWLELLPLLSPLWKKCFQAALVVEALWLTHLTWVYDHFSSYWDIFTHWQGLHSVKDLIYPITRFKFSPPGIFIKSFLYSLSQSEKFTGPFHSQLGRSALWINALTTILGTRHHRILYS